MRAAGLKWVIGFSVSLLASVQAHAQPLVARAQSIESTVANADLVFIATLVSFRRAEQGNDRDGHEATIAIEETLRAQDSVRSENPHRRVEGARALVYFKSDENMALVRPLLDDPGITYLQPADGDKAAERVYGVRYSAYQTLKSWRIDVEQPVFREAVR